MPSEHGHFSEKNMKFSFGPPQDAALGGVHCKVVSSPIKRAGISCGVGVDPGRNFGIAVLGLENLDLYYGQMPQGKYEDYGYLAYQMLHNDWMRVPYEGDAVAVVEGPAFEMTHGQAGLAYIRFGFYLALKCAGYSVRIVPPMSVRKEVFGNGLTRPGRRKDQKSVVWPDLVEHAADALACGLCAIGEMA